MSKYSRQKEAQRYLEYYLETVKAEDTKDIERAIIMCLLSDSSEINGAPFLLPEMFTDEMNREIFISIKELTDASSTVDVPTIAENLRQREIGPVKEITDYLSSLCPINASNFDFYTRILRHCHLKSLFYDLMCMAPLVLGEKAKLDFMYENVKPALIPLNRSLFGTFDNVFKPHWITNGTSTYKVLKSKFGNGGYVWIDNVAIPEVQLLASGFEVRYKDPDSE